MRVVIAGAGIAGLSTAWQMAKRGHAVTLLEQGATLPNPLAASGDHHRLIRSAYFDADGYSRMMPEAYAAWAELWADLGATHLVPTGMLGTCQRPGDAGDLMRAGLERTGLPHRRLSAAEAAERFPFLDAASFDYAVLTEDGGVLLSQHIARDLAAWLKAHGVDIRLDTRVASIDAAAGRAITTTGEVFSGDRLVVTAGAWVTALRPDLATALTAYRTVVVYLDPPDELREAWSRAPALLSTGGTRDGYVVPPVAGTHLKFGAGFMKRPTDDASRNRTADLADGRVLRDAFAPPLGRTEAYRVREVVTCVYTFTVDERFFVQDEGRTLVVSACSGHGYKFGAAVGRRVASALEQDDAEGLGRWLRAEAA